MQRSAESVTVTTASFKLREMLSAHEGGRALCAGAYLGVQRRAVSRRARSAAQLLWGYCRLPSVRGVHGDRNADFPGCHSL